MAFQRNWIIKLYLIFYGWWISRSEAGAMGKFNENILEIFSKKFF
jgi:hypothetical protein